MQQGTFPGVAKPVAPGMGGGSWHQGQYATNWKFNDRDFNNSDLYGKMRSQFHDSGRQLGLLNAGQFQSSIGLDPEHHRKTFRHAADEAGNYLRQHNAYRASQRKPPSALAPQQQPAAQPPATQPQGTGQIAPPANPLLAALQGQQQQPQPQQNGQASALARAVGGMGSAGPGVQNQEAFLKRLRQMMTTGSV